MDSLGADDFLRLAVYFIKNANISSTSSQLNITFLDTSTSSGLVVQTGVARLSSTVSSPPSNLQINTIVPSSLKFLHRADYAISLQVASASSTVPTPILINPDSVIGLMISFPQGYRQIWDKI